MRRYVYILLYSVIKFSLVLSDDDFNICLKNQREKNRQNRAVLFPEASTVGIFAAIAVPLSDRKNVFMSYNFEANYNHPYLAEEYIQQLFGKFSVDQSLGKSLDNAKQSHKQKRGAITRENIYRIFRSKLKAAGYNGHVCLLKTICQTSETPLGITNGVLGDIVHILFTPSTSEDENIPIDYYAAELIGIVGKCNYFDSFCSISLLDIISIFKE